MKNWITERSQFVCVCMYINKLYEKECICIYIENKGYLQMVGLMMTGILSYKIFDIF